MNKQISSFSEILRLLAALLAGAAALSGCAAQAPRQSSAPEVSDKAAQIVEIGRQKLLLPSHPPRVEVSSKDDLTDARVIIAHADPAHLAGQRRTRMIEAVQTPLLYEAPAGRKFLLAHGARAIATGTPPETCPAIGLSTAAAPEPRADVATKALTNCMAHLKSAGANADCGCRLLALNNSLFAKIKAFTYARGVSAHVIGGGVNATWIAEERGAADGGDGTRVWLLDLNGPRAVADLSPDGDAVLTFLANENGQLIATRRFQGDWTSEGFRRGRLAERLFLRDAQGAHLIALIGYEPAEFARRKAELTAWRSK